MPVDSFGFPRSPGWDLVLVISLREQPLQSGGQGFTLALELQGWVKWGEGDEARPPWTPSLKWPVSSKTCSRWEFSECHGFLLAFSSEHSSVCAAV